ncbi:FliM/FliN family flagellar motor switch protein [Hahella aquimaris]|uniref:FliM/FliN family flagellar motor switch protein n=1 Tax=Hahella sp. HNIBRBA332 TaxID=3015983 RepID=UPI00273C478A|nr:FliM/FliN family flagellar motor switch protein [Hahella sp. HNIBRBA332]WLQ15713.1 FliM/FliN family flagellar motor switch protein [Hahella sp. HNIBRBA332]
MSQEKDVKETNTDALVEEVILEPMKSSETGAKLRSDPLDLVKNVKVTLDVYLGDANLTVAELTALTNESVVKMNKQLNDPIELLLDGKVVARGKLVAVDDVFGIQITETSR